MPDPRPRHDQGASRPAAAASPERLVRNDDAWLLVQSGSLDNQRHGAGHPEPPLQPGKAGPVPYEGHDLPVDDEAAGLLGPERVSDLGIGAGDLLPVTGHQPKLLPGRERQAALAVEPELEEPGRVGNLSAVSVASSGSSQSGCRLRAGSRCP
ncbi:MAG: hypothetical protein WB608_05440 [Terracidiphilus sp.]